MNIRDMTPEQIRQTGLKAVEKKLGPAGLLRFLQQFERGEGDYTAERELLLTKERVKSITERIQKRRKKAANK